MSSLPGSLIYLKVNTCSTSPSAFFRRGQGTFLVVQWLRIRLPMQGSWVWTPVGELGSHMSWSNQVCVGQLLSQNTLGPTNRVCTLQQKISHDTQRSHAPQLRPFFSCPTLCNPWTVAHQAPLSMGLFRQEYWSRLPFPSPGDLPDPRDWTCVPCVFCIQDSLPLNDLGSPV